MKHKNLIFNILLLVFIFSPFYNFAQTPADFRASYDLEYAEAITWVDKNKILINKELKDKNAFILAIAFPELVRYETWKNVIEMYSLELDYVQSGTKNVDFSVGFFQIKPSFVEYLEKQSIKYSLPEKSIKYLKISNLQVKEARKKRLERLKTAEGQLRYLKIFYQIAWRKYALHLSKLSTSEQLEFLATAYNLGLQHTSETITKYQSNKYFPYGKSYRGTQYNYGKIAVDFYQNFAQKLLR